ncbi:MAG: CBS domain-containing protein [Chloroflexota bacterium]
MRIVLTHEQADFDALASLLGAYLLDEESLPILPRKLNRNVQAFLTLYGGDLPFLDPRDMPKGPIETVTIVDTQSAVSIKGMNKKTQIVVIDHHPLRSNIPSSWSVTTEEIGATTSLLVEALQIKNGGLSIPQATLLLLGIYEDTGSLIYSRTTARDAMATAFLLEQGANLQIVQEFLNQPLSTSQQVIYEELHRNLETHIVHGHKIIFACGESLQTDEELSSIAHKLRDFIDSDAIFLLITTRAGVQLIARSTTNNVDVAKIAAHFGGGGHNRASAALIKDSKLEQVHADLLKLLPQVVQPAVTVQEIMSTNPQMLSPNISAKNASEQMQRYGYEGFPVVENGAVVGLLTRRDVDRSLAHNLNLKASELMIAGDVHVEPLDSVEVLQQTMTNSNWGQIPVIDSDHGNIVGIVTRTDLIKTLTDYPRVWGKENLAEKLETSLSPAHLALLETIAGVALLQNVALYIVGGFVRDLLLDASSPDFDLVVEGDAISLAKQLKKSYGGTVISHKQFGTAKWKIGGIRKQLANILKDGYVGSVSPDDFPDSIDLVSARKEFYTHPTALPEVERGSIKLDLHRRDFTINTLALRLDGRHYGELHDHWGGRNDIREGIVRVLHSLSFVDDATRILRAVKFEQRFNFKIDGRTLELLHSALSLLPRVSGDRIRHELENILLGKHAAKTFARLTELNILTEIHPNLIWDTNHGGRLQELPPSEEDLNKWELQGLDNSLVWPGIAYVIWLSALTAEQAASAAKRLKLRRELVKAVVAATKLHRALPNVSKLSPGEIEMRVSQIPALAIFGVHLINKGNKLDAVLVDYAEKWRTVRTHISGSDLLSLGVKPGPDYKRILSNIRMAKIDGKISTEADERKLLGSLIDE